MIGWLLEQYCWGTYAEGLAAEPNVRFLGLDPWSIRGQERDAETLIFVLCPHAGTRRWYRVVAIVMVYRNGHCNDKGPGIRAK